MIEIYGRENCPWCTKARLYCEDKQLTYKYFTVGKDVTREWLLEKFPEVKTVPVVVIDNEWIGGYTQLTEKYDV